jgi:hypothetical protein
VKAGSLIPRLYIAAANGDPIAQIAGNPAQSDWGRREGYANANAIAQVPTMIEALIQAEACMSIVEPRSDKAEYLRILGVVREALDPLHEKGVI